jgi:hypothetical protein
MSFNSELSKLHDERMSRRLVSAIEVIDEEVVAVDQYECPVCYTDGADSGIVEPLCKHKLCLSCYSNILLLGRENSRCPCCRKAYLKTATIVEDVNDPYYGLPPLVSDDYPIYVTASNRLNADVLTSWDMLYLQNHHSINLDIVPNIMEQT